MNEMNEKVAVLYSGGSDSTLVAARLTEKCEEIHLLSYIYSGVVNSERSTVNVARLRERFKSHKFVHHIINLDKFLQEMLYGNYLKDLAKYRLFMLSYCPICAFIMHTRTLVYCLENEIYNVCDGANRQRGRSYPHQVQRVMAEYKKFYAEYGISYSSPIYDESPDTDHILFEMGLYPVRNVKSNPEENAKVEATCHLKVLYHTVSQGYYFLIHGHDKYEDLTIRYYRDKWNSLKRLIDDYLSDKENSKLSTLL